MTAAEKGFLLLSILKMLVVFTVTMIGVALLTLMERKVSAWMQNRHGPNRVGWAGLLQPAADGIKNIVKEETYPAEANKWLFFLAPALAFIPALLLGAVIPWAAPLPVSWDANLPLIGAVSYHGPLSMAVADLRWDFSSCSRSARSECTGSRWRAGPPTTSTPCWAGSGPAPR